MKEVPKKEKEPKLPIGERIIGAILGAGFRIYFEVKDVKDRVKRFLDSL